VAKLAPAAASALALVCLLGLAACSDGDRHENTAPSPGVAAEAEALGAYVVDVASGEVTRLTEGEGYSVVSWSQDSSALTLSQGELTGDQDIYSANADGSQLTLTGTVGGWMGPWSPDGRAVIRYEAGQGTRPVQYGLYVTSLGAREGRRVADGFLGVWSPDGERIAFVGNFCDEERNYVGVVKADGSDLVKLTDVDALQVGHAWSPDGRSLAFSAPDDAGVPQIYLADVENSTRVKLTDGPSLKMRPAWSADGALLSFAALEGGGPGATFTYWVVPKEGGDTSPLPAGVGDLAWAPQGRQLAFAGGDELQVLNLEGSGQPTAVAELGQSDEVDFQWSPDGRRIAFIKEGQIYVVGVDGSGEKQLTSETTLQAADGSGGPVIIDSIRWSPSGAEVAFAVVLPSAARGVCG
jgi:Tol biopolymer transport system component